MCTVYHYNIYNGPHITRICFHFLRNVLSCIQVYCFGLQNRIIGASMHIAAYRLYLLLRYILL